MGRLAIANKQFFFIVGLQVLSFCLQALCMLTIEKFEMTKWVPHVTF